ncbi:ribonuclease domain-containing protein [Marmoricola sp. RAF53]|uniref:ribonuclease domain-containing protein n=1 Tax=Marmoricola sp. RAF53 TaxID=3233059 RepID=UPI003F98F37E
MSPRTRTLLALVGALLAASLLWWSQQPSGDEPAGGSTATSGATAGAATSGATAGAGDTVGLADLPPEARAVARAIHAGGPFRYDRDGVTFGNREGLLPSRPRGFYREYTVPTPGESDRGARRIVAGQDGRLYWTSDHYASFRRIEE